ncbi:MAG: flippase [Methanobacterium sp.]|nr:flippase [Methanobacterium sp.]
MSSKIAKGSIVILMGSFLYRIGGYIYKIAMTNLLGEVGYGILSLTMPLQGFFIIIAGAGLPPAIAKYVSQYHAQNNVEMVKAIISVATIMMTVFGLIFSVLIFFLAQPIAIALHNPDATLPFQLIALITPFSVIVGAMRGTFQGFYQMTNILLTRAMELIFMVVMAIILVYAGLYVAGAVIGTAMGFMAALGIAIYLFQRDVRKKLIRPRNLLSKAITPIDFNDKIGIAWMLIFFSIPIVITGLAELALYDIATIIIPIYYPISYAGYFNVSSTIARLPLIISMAVATSVLPATAEAMSLKDHDLMNIYIKQSYRYVSFFVIPLCVGTIIFASPILNLLFGEKFLPGTAALQILAVGMFFFTLYTISSSISQGLGKPRLPMYALVAGTTIDLILSLILIPPWGINGAAIATTLSALFIMTTLMRTTLKLANIKLPLYEYIKIIIAALIMGIFFIPFPHTKISLIIGIIFSPFIYLGTLALIGGLKLEDLKLLYNVADRLGPFSGVLRNLINILSRFAVE